MKRGYYLIVKPIFGDGGYTNAEEMPHKKRIESAALFVENASKTFGDGHYMLLKVGPDGKTAEIVEQFGVHPKAEVLKGERS